jgi:hypothetical protein
MTERALRKHDVLAAADHIVEWKQGKIERWWVEGSVQPMSRAFNKLDIPQLRGLASCSYSSRRLFFGSLGLLYFDLEFLCYGDRLTKAADDAGLPTASPRD